MFHKSHSPILDWGCRSLRIDRFLEEKVIALWRIWERPCRHAWVRLVEIRVLELGAVQRKGRRSKTLLCCFVDDDGIMERSDDERLFQGWKFLRRFFLLRRCEKAISSVKLPERINGRRMIQNSFPLKLSVELLESQICWDHVRCLRWRRRGQTVEGNRDSWSIYIIKDLAPFHELYVVDGKTIRPKHNKARHHTSLMVLPLLVDPTSCIGGETISPESKTHIMCRIQVGPYCNLYQVLTVNGPTYGTWTHCPDGPNNPVITTRSKRQPPYY